MKKMYFFYLDFLDKLRRVIRWGRLHSYFHKTIIRYLEKNYKEVIDQFVSMDKEVIQKRIIDQTWVMWWQGEDNMPPLVKKCYDNSKKWCNNICLITKDNYKDYLELPLDVEKKIDSGHIKMAQLSDIIRVNLLYNYGGLWIDSTIFLNEFDFNKSLKNPYWTVKGKDFSKGKYVPRGRWRGFIQYSQKEYTVQFFMVTMFNEYWRKENRLINFFLIDYFYFLAYKHNIGGFGETIDFIESSSDDIYKLDELLLKNKNIDFNTLDSNIFKLNWKHPYKEYTNSKELTSYGRFLKQK